jgi:hypothetical protein
MAVPGRRDRTFTRADYITQARILEAAAALMDGRSSHARLYRRLATMLVYADANLPPGLPRPPSKPKGKR